MVLANVMSLLLPLKTWKNDELIDIINGLDYKNVELDYIKQIYENLIPNSIRHSMGEFYIRLVIKIILRDFKKHNNLENKFFLDPNVEPVLFYLIFLMNLRIKELIWIKFVVLILTQ